MAAPRLPEPLWDGCLAFVKAPGTLGESMDRLEFLGPRMGMRPGRFHQQLRLPIRVLFETQLPSW